MGGMLHKCNNLITIPNFDTSNVTNMASMVRNCQNLTSIPNFNTLKVRNIANMFENCSNLHDLPSYNCDNITDITNTFGNYSSGTGSYKTSFGPLVNLGKAFSGIPANNVKTTLDLYWVTDTDSAPVVSATSQLYNIASQNFQQILIMGETYYNMTVAQREAITNKG